MADRQPPPRAQPEPRINGVPDSAHTEAIRAKQKAMSEAGFATAIDGKWGPDSEKMWAQFQEKQRRDAQTESERRQEEARAASEKAAIERAQAEAANKRADADTKAAEARAAGAAARAREAEAKAAETKAKADQDKRDADAQRSKLSTPLLAAAVVGGTLYGGAKAKTLKAEYDAGTKKKDAALQKSAKELESLIKKSEKQTGAAKSATMKKIAGHVKAVDAQQLNRLKGGVKGAAVAAIPFLIEGALSRAVSLRRWRKATERISSTKRAPLWALLARPYSASASPTSPTAGTSWTRRNKGLI